MLHTNVAELRLLCDTFTRVWSAGGQANLSLQTKDSQMWAKLDLQLGPADGHRPGPPVAGERGGVQPPQVRRKGPSARARDARRRQEWQERRNEPALELPASHNQVPGTQPELEPEQQSQENLLTAEAPNSTVVEETTDETVDTNTDMIPQLDGPVEIGCARTSPVNTDFKCEQCSFKAGTGQMVKYHTRLKHRTHHCEQGFEEYIFLPNGICPLCPVESGYCKCGSCDECKDFRTEHGFNYHMMNEHSPDDILAHFGADWIKEHTQYIHRNNKFIEDRQQSKKWDIFINEKHLE